MKMNKAREQLIKMYTDSLNENVLPWRKGWNDDYSIHHYNPISKTNYKGINNSLLSIVSAIRGYKDPRWMTFNQIKSQGWDLSDAKGQGVPIEFWSIYDTANKTAISFDEYNMIILNQPDRKKDFRIMDRIYHVFNATHVQGIPEFVIEEQPKKVMQSSPFIDNLIKNMKVHYNEQGNSAFYSPAEDTVFVPRSHQFHNEYEYNATRLHELCHATGHTSRLNRDLKYAFGSSEYAREELRAEISSSFIAQDLSLDSSQMNLDNHKAYIQAWIKILKDEPNELFKAIKDAESISQYILETGEVEKFRLQELGEAITKPRFFIDMDGTLVHFNNTIPSLEVLHKKGYFRNLVPQDKIVELTKELLKQCPGQVYVLSAKLDSPYAAQEKIEWLEEHIPELPKDHIILTPYGMPKYEYVPGGIQTQDVMLDDYTNNLVTWEQQGGKSIKVLNNINSTKNTWKGCSIHYHEDPKKMAQYIEKVTVASKEEINALAKLRLTQPSETMQININYVNNDIHSIQEKLKDLNTIFNRISHSDEISEIRVNLDVDNRPFLRNEKITKSDLLQHDFKDTNETSIFEILKEKAKNNLLFHEPNSHDFDKFAKLDQLLTTMNEVVTIEESITIGI